MFETNMEISYVAYLLMFNGLYDILSSVLLIFQHKGPHRMMYVFPPDDPAVLRFMGYWIFTYGWIRLLCGMLWSNDKTIHYLAISSYIIEAVGFEYELYKEQSLSRKIVACVTALCLLIIIFIHKFNIA